MTAWPESVERVASVLRERGVQARLEEFEHGTGSARDAARAVGCELEQIVKSLVFICDGAAVLALLPGDRRASVAKVAAATGAFDARVARPEEVVAATGFEPGAVAPFPAPQVVGTFIDHALLTQDVVWCGAGSDRHIMGLSPLEVARVTQAIAADLAEEA
jgi:prolyl-tRNA editing enzyme YbaK/EbsC (Cys-tRNA(Pro) deacylase)